jgi:Tol biopolymer transport system component
MKTIESFAKGIVGLLVLGVLVILLNGLFASASQTAQLGDTKAAAAPTPVATRIPPIQLANLKVVGITPFKFDCPVDAELAPDGEQFICSNKDGLWYGSLGKGIEKRLADSGYPEWFPDGKRIAYFQVAPPGKLSKLYQIDISSGAQTIISNATSGFHIRISAQNQLLFPEKGRLQVWNPQTKVSTPLSFQTSSGAASNYVPEFSTDINSLDSDYSLSPDGQHIVVHGVLYGGGTLYLINLVSGQAITLTKTIEDYYQPFGWSPDGRQLAFDIQVPYDHPELWLINADGTNLHRIWQGPYRGAFTHLTWMPDGQTLLFIYQAMASTAEVYDVYEAINVNGGPPKDLFKDGGTLTIHAGGKRLMFTRTMSELYKRYIVNLEW